MLQMGPQDKAVFKKTGLRSARQYSVTKCLAEQAGPGESRAPDCVCHSLAAAVRNAGGGAKVARFALTCVGCRRTRELISSCCSSI